MPHQTHLVAKPGMGTRRGRRLEYSFRHPVAIWPAVADDEPHDAYNEKDAREGVFIVGVEPGVMDQMDAPSRWIATQALVSRPTFTGRTRQNMMNGVPSFL